VRTIDGTLSAVVETLEWRCGFVAQLPPTVLLMVYRPCSPLNAMGSTHQGGPHVLAAHHIIRKLSLFRYEFSKYDWRAAISFLGAPYVFAWS
jgi:hypothetical protein